MLVAVESHALLGSFGHGDADLATAIEEHKACIAQAPPPRAYAFPFLPRTDTSGLAAFHNPRALRQLDHFTRMALLGVGMALKDAPSPKDESGITGIILASGYGAAEPTFSFMDSVLQYGEDMVSPLAFSHSVQNIPAAIIARQYGFIGPCLTVCQPAGAFPAALEVACLWLEQEMAHRVILIAADEQHPFLPKVAQQLYSEQGIPPGDVSFGLGEGAAVFVLTAAKGNDADPQPRLELLPERDKVYPGSKEGIPCAFSSVTPFVSPGQETLFTGACGYGILPVAQALDVSLHLALVAKNPLLAPSGHVCVSTADKSIIYCHIEAIPA